MNIAYVGNIGAEGTAMSVHARNIANILVKLGHNVRFICSEPGFYKNKVNGNSDYSYTYVKRNFDFPVIRSIEYRIELITGINLTLLLKKMNEKHRFDLVILYGYSGEKRIINFCKKNKILIIADRVDWFEKDDLEDTLYNKWFCKYIIENSMTNLDKKLDGIISISHFLDNYYKKMNICSIWVPPVFDSFNENVHFGVNDPPILVYAGCLGGNKDIIAPVIKALSIINSRKIKIKLELVGISEHEINEIYHDYNPKDIGIFAHGYVEHKKAQIIISKADFGILLRHDKKYAKAGFSTKFSECMSNGIPMICTAVGGADTIIENYVDGLLVENNQVNTIVNKLTQIINMPNDRIIAMKHAAYKKAYATFSSCMYEDKMHEFLKTISEKV